MIKLQGTRFGDIEVQEGNELVFPRGLFGFPEQKRYALLYPGGQGRVAWLQSLDMPSLAFPIVDGAILGPDYPKPGPTQLAQDAGLGSDDVAVVVVIAGGKSRGLVANMLAPLVIDRTSRTGAQIVLDPDLYSPSAQIRPPGTQIEAQR